MGDPRAVFGGPSSQENAVENGVSTDSRTLRRKDIYFAIKGDRYDGHAFIDECVKKGASLCVVSQIPQNLAIPPGEAAAIVKVKDTKKALADCAKFYRKKYGPKLQTVGIAGSCG